MRTKSVIVLAIAALALAFSWFVHWNRRSEAGPGRGWNVVLITLDTTRADRLGCYGYARALTPALDELAAKGVLFEQAFCSAPLTLPSHATMLTGLHPPEHGLRVNAKKSLDSTTVTVAEVLRKAGYRTGAFIASFVLDSEFGLDGGFDVYDDGEADNDSVQSAEAKVMQYRSGDRVTDAALKWLAGVDEPFFCWVHLFDPHQPYRRHEALAGTAFAGKPSYDSEIAFADMQVRRLMDFLSGRHLSDRTLVVVVGDHGEGFGQHGEIDHGWMLYDTTMRVPLIFSLPGRVGQGQRSDALVSLVDLMPTILEFAGIERASTGMGRSLGAALSGGAAGVPGLLWRDGYALLVFQVEPAAGSDHAGMEVYPDGAGGALRSAIGSGGAEESGR